MINRFVSGMRTIINDRDEIPIEELVRDNNIPRLVMWERNGLFRLISLPIVINVIEAYHNWLKKKDGSRFIPSIRWEQGVDVDPKIARILLGE